MIRRGIESRIPAPSEREYNMAIDGQIAETFEGLQRDFEQAPNKLDRLPFHNRAHSEAVMKRARKILEAIQGSDPGAISNRNIKLAELIAANHDTVQDWQEAVVNGQTKRQRFIERNEIASFEKLIGKLRQANAKSGQEIFTAEDFQLAKEAILATVPGFDMKVGTVVQPKLSAESSVVARAVALADLGTAGMEGPGIFLSEGDALFREENLDILDAVDHPGEISDQLKKVYVERMLAWTKFQPKFAAGRKLKLEEELQGLPPDAQTAVRGLFSHFDDSIAAATDLAQNREQRIKSGDLNFETLAEEMGFEVRAEIAEIKLPLAA